MNRSTTQLTPEQYRAEAARRMAGFTYTCLASVPGAVNVWHCARPGTGIYSFTITELANGMAVTGDIDGLLFSVRSFDPGGYGIPFLTHTDKRYVAEKLEAQCRAMEFDPDSFAFMVAECAAAKVNEILDDWPGHPLDRSKWGADATPASVPTFDEVRDAVEALHASIDHHTRHDLVSRVACLRSHLDEAAEIEDAEEAHRWIHALESYFGISDTWEWRLERLDSELMQRLYMLELAATEIIKARKAMEEAQADTITDRAADRGNHGA